MNLDKKHLSSLERGGLLMINAGEPKRKCRTSATKATLAHIEVALQVVLFFQKEIK